MNNYAVSSDGIATALQDSASALMEGGNNLEQATALVAAANRVVQDPNSVGSALRTISLRLRGTSVEILEEMGEETDGAVESVSKLQEKIKALSGIDILTESGDYKDTYTILRQIGTVWEEMSDIDQAALLELMAGKNRANTLSAILSNMKDLEGAYNDALNAEGSALKENEAYLDSIQGKIDQFTNTLQTFWMNMLDSDVIKEIVELGTNLLQMVNTPFKLLLAGLSGVVFYFTAIKKHNPVTMFKDLVANTHNYGQALKQVQAIQSLNGANGSATMDATTFNEQHIKAYGMAVEGLTQKQQVAILATAGLNKEQIAQAIGVRDLTDANFQAALAEAQVITQKKNDIAVSGALILANQKQNNISLSTTAQNWLEANSEQEITKRLLAQAVAKGVLEHKDAAAILLSIRQTQVNMQQTSTWKLLTSSIKQLIQQNPAIFFTMLSTAVSAFVGWIEKAIDKTEKLTDEYNKLQTSISNIEGEISSLDSELSTLQDKIDDLQSKGSLSLVEAEELKKLKEQSSELERQKELQEKLLKARGEQNQVQSTAMIDNILAKTTANQEKTTENVKSVAKVVGGVASVVGLLAAWGGAIIEPTPAGEAAAASATPKLLANILAAVKALGPSLTVAVPSMYSIGSNIGGLAGQGINSMVSKNMAADSLIEWYESYEKAIIEAQQKADAAEAKYVSDMSDDNYDSWQKKVEAVNTLQTEMYDRLQELQGYISNLEYTDKTAGIIDGYNELIAHLDVKASGDSIDSQISSIEALKDEYELLSKGVSENGKNVALSAEEYARYNSIVKQVLGYAPNLIQSYNDEGEAIFNRNSLIQDSIDLLQEQQRLAAISLVNDDSILSTFNSSKENYEKQNEIKLNKNISGDLKSGLEGLIGKEQSFGQTDENYILENIDVIRQKWSEVIELARQTEGEEFAATFRSNLQDIFTQLNYAEGAMSQFKQSLFAVPQTSEYYNDLTGDHLNFINSYISTFDNLSEFTENEVLQVRNSIFALTEMIGSSEIAQGLVESLFKVDSSLPVKAYVESIGNILSQMVNQGFIDEKTKVKLFEQFVPDAENIDVMLETIGNKLSNGAGKLQDMNLSELKIAYRIIADADPVSMSFEELQTKIDEYSNKSINISVPTLSSLVATTESLNELSDQTAEITINNTEVTQDYRDTLIELVGSEEKVNKYFDENNKLIVKDAKGLNNLVKSTKKNTAASAALAKSQARLQYYELYKEIRQLVGGQAVTNAATLKQIYALYEEMNALEKTIARYSALEEQLLGAANAYEKFAQAQEIDSQTDYISSAEDMITALGQAFSTAELGTETAQTAIAGLVPESVYEDLDTVDEKMAAIHKYFKEGKLSQYFDIQFNDDGAIESVEMKLGNLRKFIEDGLHGDHNGDGINVFEGTDWQHFEFSKSFLDGLDEADDKLQYFADQMGVTKEVAFAFIESINDHDIEWLNGDYSSMFDVLTPETLENSIYSTTHAMADLEVKLATGKISAEEYRNSMYGLSGQLSSGIITQEKYDAVLSDLNQQLADGKITLQEYNETVYGLAGQEAILADRAREETAAWHDKTEQLEKYKTQLQEYQKQLETGKDSDGNIIDPTKVQQNIDEVSEKINTLTGELKNLEEPTELTLQIALQDIQEELTTLEKKFESQGIDIKAHLVWDTKNSKWTVNEDSELNGDQNVKQYVDLLNDQSDIEKILDDGVVTVEDHLASIEDLLANIRELLGGESKDKDKMKETPATNIDKVKEVATEKIDDLKLKAQELFSTTLPNAWDEFWDNVDQFFDSVGEWANGLKESAVTFFTETVPEKWDEFWNGVSEFFSEVAQQAGILKEQLSTFFTETVPQKWDEFWDDVDAFFTKSLPYAIGYAAGAITKFFTKTIPEKWDEFLNISGEAWNSVRQWAANIKEKVVEFFTLTIPNAWSDFWTSVGVYIDETLIPTLQSFADTIKSFFTETIPTKWSEFWTNVGNFITETLVPALQNAKDKVVEFFLTTIPAKWSEFWSSVGTFLTETAPQALENVKEGITTFFTVTLPDAINGLWGGIKTWISDKASSFWENLKAGFTSGKTGDNDGDSDSGNGKEGAHGVNGTAHAKGTVRTGKAYKSGDWGLPTDEHDALVGELGPELVVNPNTGRYYTVGDNGAEMVDLPKGAIIFNHKQTEGLLKNGYVTSRGKAYAEGNAHSGKVTIYADASSKDQWEGTGYSGPDDPTWDASEALSDAADKAADSADEFAETLDWIEIRLEELDEDLGKLNAELENAADYAEKNNKINKIIAKNQEKMANLDAGAEYYEKYAQKFWKDIPKQYRDAAKNGAIAITDFAGEASESVVENIQKYREYVQKAADLKQQKEELKTEQRNLAIQKIDNAQHSGDVRATVEDSQTEKLQNAVDFDEERGMITDPNYYAAMMENSNKKIEYLTNARKQMQKEFDKAVKTGKLEKGSDEWYENLDKLYQMDAAIDEAGIELEQFQNSINDIYWDSFDEVINNYDYLSNETQGLIDVLSNADMVIEPDDINGWTEDDVNFSKEAIATMGLHAQEMERQQAKAQDYAVAIADLNKEYAAGHYSESEYKEKLDELTQGQYAAIKAAEDEKDAIADVQKQRVESIKKGINKQIEAYSKLIEKAKEELNAEKELYDFQKQSAEGQKNIADIERQLAALANDNSLSAIAQRKQLEAELAEARDAQEDLYYNRSIDNKNKAYDEELKGFTEEKEAELAKWDEYMEDVEKMVTESLGIVQKNAEEIGKTLTEKTEEYNLTVSSAVLDPWKDGATAIDDYTGKFAEGGPVSSTITMLDGIKGKWGEIKTAIENANLEADKYYDKKAGTADGLTVDQLNKENEGYYKNQGGNQTGGGAGNGNGNGNGNTGGGNNEPTKELPKKGTSVTVKKSATHFSAQSGNTKMASFVPGSTYTVYNTKGTGKSAQVLIGKNGKYTGWVKVTDLQGYAKGTVSAKKDQLALIDELGEELQLVPGDNGRLEYIKKGTGIVPAQLTERLMDLAMNPQEMLDRNRPKITPSKNVVNTEIDIDMHIAEVVHIDKVTNDTLPDLTKAVEKQMDVYMTKLNNALKRYSR